MNWLIRSTAQAVKTVLFSNELATVRIVVVLSVQIVALSRYWMMVGKNIHDTHDNDDCAFTHSPLESLEFMTVCNICYIGAEGMRNSFITDDEHFSSRQSLFKM